MTQGQAVTILLSVGPLIHRMLHDGPRTTLSTHRVFGPRRKPRVALRPLSLSSAFHNTAYNVKTDTPPEKASKNSSNLPTSGPRSVQSGFTHRLRDGKNHIYFTTKRADGSVFRRPLFGLQVREMAYGFTARR